MSKAIDRRARRAGLTIKKSRRGTVYANPLTGLSIFDGLRSTKSWHHDRRVDAFFRKVEKGGLP